MKHMTILLALSIGLSSTVAFSRTNVNDIVTRLQSPQLKQVLGEDGYVFSLSYSMGTISMTVEDSSDATFCLNFAENGSMSKRAGECYRH